MLKRTPNKWIVVLGAVLVQICIGAVYTWSLFNQPLMDKYNWPKQDVVLTFSITIAVFAFSTIFAGRLQDKIGPRRVATAGGILLGLGLILSSRASSHIALYISYGVIGGMGVGTAYVCPLSTCLKWFPERRGFITGIAVGAFGLGSLIFEPLIVSLIRSRGVSETFFYLGIIYASLIVLGAQLLKVPAEAISAGNGSKDSLKIQNEYTTIEMLKTPLFYVFWVLFLVGTLSGLMVISLAKDIGIELAGLSPKTASLAVGAMAIFNASGRLVWGILSDRLGRINCFFYMYLITALAMLIMSLMSLNFALFFLSISLTAFSFGGFLAVFPTLTADFYGTRNLGGNYGIMYQAYGASALIGPIIATSAGFKPSFTLAAVMSLAGALVILAVKRIKSIS